MVVVIFLFYTRLGVMKHRTGMIWSTNLDHNPNSSPNPNLFYPFFQIVHKLAS